MNDLLRILIIDDDDVDRMTILRACKSAGLNIEATEAQNGKAGLELLQMQAFDCAFLDYLLPDSDGLKILRAARAAGVATPIVMLTGHGDERLAVEMMQAGANDYLPKGNISPEKLAHSLRHAMRLHQAEMDRQAVERELQASNRRITDILESISDAFFAVADDWHVTYINKEAERLLQTQRENLLDHNLWDRLPLFAPWFREALIKVMIQKAPLTTEGFDAQSGLWIEAHSYPGNDGISVYFRDITERKKAETGILQYNLELSELNQKLQEAQNQLLQSEKMAAVGQLAAGVAHEINNPIGYVHSNLGTLEKYLQDVFGMLDVYEQAESMIADGTVLSRLQAAKQKFGLGFMKEDVPALMSESKEGITRVKKIVQDLKDFSHVDATEEWQWTDLRKGIDSTLSIVNNEIKYKAQVVKEYGVIPEVECLSPQLNQVFMNLLVNAAHAIEARGTITIRTGIEGEEVWVEVADTGKGIAQENLKRIFDPFFTTKPIGKGTGLGLSLSYGIIQKHHGRIEVKSEVGKGTTFRVCLPIKQVFSATSAVSG
ncbi:MAG: ATP-binding protein [Gammaproteobacteria bacterium]